MTETVQFTTHGKTILIGEHSVVYGYRALALPILNLKITTSVTPFPGPVYMDTNYYHGNLFDAPANYDGLKYVAQTMMQKAQVQSSFKLTYTGQIPMERGFGSSASVALGTSLALNQFFALNLSRAEILAITNHAEMINHGKASGLDAATVASDQLVAFDKETGVQAVKGKLQASLLIMDTGELGNTKQAVSQVKKLYDASETVKAQMQQLDLLAKDVQSCWETHDAEQVGRDFTQAQEILASFGLATEQIKQLVTTANQAGALGTKLSGGGLGGIVIALCPNQRIAKEVAAKCQNLMTNYWIEEI